LSGKIRPYLLSSGIFLDFSTFKPEKTWPENFQSKIFSGFQISRQKFSGKKLSRPKKVRVFFFCIGLGDVKGVLL